MNKQKTFCDEYTEYFNALVVVVGILSDSGIDWGEKLIVKRTELF